MLEVVKEVIPKRKPSQEFMKARLEMQNLPQKNKHSMGSLGSGGRYN